MDRPTKEEVDEVLAKHGTALADNGILRMWCGTLAAEVRALREELWVALRAENERLKAELTHNAEREQQVYAVFDANGRLRAEAEAANKARAFVGVDIGADGGTAEITASMRDGVLVVEKVDYKPPTGSKG